MRLTRLFTLLAALAVPATAMAAAGPQEACSDLDAAQNATTGAWSITPAINGAAMTSSRTFTFTQPIRKDPPVASYDYLLLDVQLVDANTSITRLDLTWTGSHDDNTTDFTPQRCIMVNGVCKSIGGGIKRKYSPGSTAWEWVIPIHGAQDIEGTISVGTGSAASADLLTVTRRACVGPVPDVEIPPPPCIPVPGSTEEITSTNAASDTSTQLKPSTRYQISFVTASWFDTSTSSSCTAASGDARFPADFVYEFATTETVMWICALNVTSTASAWLWECQQ